MVRAREGGKPGLNAASSPRTAEPDNRYRSPGRAVAELWGAHPAPVVMVHFVCAAWPGSGGRLAAMELWGKWYQADIWQQLRSGERPR